MPPKRKFQFAPGDAFDVAVALKLVEGVDEVATQGFSKDLAPDAETDISLLDTTLIPFPSNDGEAMVIVSTLVGDIGLVEVHALGPGGSFLEPIIVQLDGQTPVALTGNGGELLSRINFARNASPAGFDGTITIENVARTVIFANMLELYQSTMQTRYSVPVGKKGILKTAVGSMRKQGGTDTAMGILIHIKPFTFEKWYHPFGFGLQRSGATTVSLVNAYPTAVNGPFDIGMSATASVSGAQAAGRVAGLMIDV